jgi:S-adenosylmethionine synthetase
VGYQVELEPGSAELGGIFEGETDVLGANDTSASVGYAPLTETERLVLETEHYLNSDDFKAEFPETGQDVKVMGVRNGGRLALTVAMPLLDRDIPGEAAYWDRKEAVGDDLLNHLQGWLADIGDVSVVLNALDRPGEGMSGMYLSVLGTSAEDADSGQVGRGNGVNGILPLNRPRSSEAAAGKNPVSHVGKIYNLLSHRIAHCVWEEIPDVLECTVWLVSRIGDPVNAPRTVYVRANVEDETGDLGQAVRRTVAEQVERIPEFCRELVEGRHPVC